MRICIGLVSGFLSLCCIVLKAQDVQFSQYYNTPLYANPAFAGTGENTRIGLQYRTQWTNVAKPYTTYALWGDHYIESARSGVGLWLMRDAQGDTRMRSTELVASYSYVIPLSNTWVFRPGLQAGFAVRDVDYYSALFGDQLDNNGFTGNGTGDPLLQNNRSSVYPDFGAGGLLYNDHFWFSLGVNHINTPNQSVYKTPGYDLPMRTTVQTGYTIILNENKYNPSTKEISITPTLNYKQQGSAHQLDIGFYYTYSPIMLGLWYRGIPGLSYSPGLSSNESIIPMVGYVVSGWSFTYSYDYSISRLTNKSSAGSHEISLIYEFSIPYRKSGIQKRIPCPKFHHQYQ